MDNKFLWYTSEQDTNRKTTVNQEIFNNVGLPDKQSNFLML